uniref:NADH dehydrogenase subunit 4L n=1 Tax=Halistemma rubrum TaxID=316183 RepID=UPI0026E2E756|nr:NADH dehydrogenase subunit 4L [Halistemma rubrum]WJJ70216.1 NADH dehydrogenase subunit 4L [Halistemma rubrum]
MLLLLFIISVIGIILNRTHTILILICIELMLLSITLNFIINTTKLISISGQIYSLYIITVAAVETAIGLSILITFYKIRGSISINLINLLKG